MRHCLVLAVALSMFGLARAPADQPASKPLVQAGEFVRIYDPSVGEKTKWYINDHCFIRGRDGTWHLFGITHREPADAMDEKNLAHAIARTLLMDPWNARPLATPWDKQPFALSAVADPWCEAHLWAPYVVEHDGLYYMFYCAGDMAPSGNVDHTKYRIHLATSPDLRTWTRHKANPMVVDGFDARDPFVTRIGDRWIMYYTATSAPEEGNHVVACVESNDLTHWKNRKVVFTDPSRGKWGGPTESPFVVRRGDAYYLFIGPRDDYDATAVYRSRDPFHWRIEDKVGHIASHAAEVVRDEDGRWYVSRCGWGRGGVYLAPLTWNDGLDAAPTNIPAPKPAARPAANTAPKAFPYPYTQQTLPNGLTLVVVPMPTPGLVSYFSVVRTGSRDEVEPGRSGYAHFFEHMMFRGTKKYPGDVYDRIITSIGAQANASTTDDFTTYYLTFMRDDLERVIELESDRFQNLDYGKAAFQTEAGAIYGEYRIGAASPRFFLEEKLQNLAYDVHTYKHTTIGFEADVKAMPEGYDYSREFHRRFYRPDNTVLLVVGDIEPPAVLKLVQQYYGGWKKGYEPPKITPEPPQTAPRVDDVAFAGRTLPILTVAYKGDAFDPTNRDYAAAALLGPLAFGPQSELHKKLVLRQQRVEMLHCDIPMNRDQPLFQITAMVKRADDVDAVRDEILATLEHFKATPVAAQELADLKRRNRYGFVMQLDTTERVAWALAQFAELTGGVDAVEQWFTACDAVTPDEIMHAAGEYFAPQRRTVVVLKGEGGRGKGEEGKAESGKPKAEETPLAALRKAGETPLADSRPASPLPPGEGQSEGGAGVSLKTPIPETQCVLLPVAADPTIAIRLWFRVGSQDDPPGKEGLAALTAAMLAEGSTQSNRYEQILDKLFPLAAGYSASPTVEMTVISGRVHRDNLDAFYPLLIDAVQRPAFRQDDLDRIKARALNYLENALPYSNDEELGKAALQTSVFAGTPYGHLSVGSVAGIRAITLDDVQAFYRKHFTRGNVVVGLGGGYAPALARRFRSDLAALPEGSPPATPAPKPAPISGRRVTIVEKDCASTAISAGFPIDVVRGSKDWYALALANCWLGQHRNQNGRLYQVIRDARGLNYGDYSYIEHFPHGGATLTPPVNVCRRQQMFELWLRPVPHPARQFALRAALHEVKNLVEHGMTESDLAATRDFLRKFLVHLAPTTDERLGYAMDDRFYGINGSHLEKFRRAMDELTLADVNAAIRRHLQNDSFDIVMVTRDAESLRAALVADAPSPITYATPKSEAVLTEDREISAFPLDIPKENVRIVPVNDLFAP